MVTGETEELEQKISKMVSEVEMAMTSIDELDQKWTNALTLNSDKAEQLKQARQKLVTATQKIQSKYKTMGTQIDKQIQKLLSKTSVGVVETESLVFHFFIFSFINFQFSEQHKGINCRRGSHPRRIGILFSKLFIENF